MAYYLSVYGPFFLVFAFGVIMPGADFAMVLRQSILVGRKNAIITSCGIGAAILVHATYTILGLGIIIAHSLWLFNMIKWAGVAYLLYLGLSALRSKGTAFTIADEQKVLSIQSNKKAFMLGFAVNMLNPKAVFVFLSFFSTLLPPTVSMHGKIGLAFTMAAFIILWFSAVSLFMTTPVMRQFFSRASKWIDRICGTVFIVLGIRLMFQKAS